MATKRLEAAPALQLSLVAAETAARISETRAVTLSSAAASASPCVVVVAAAVCCVSSGVEVISTGDNVAECLSASSCVLQGEMADMKETSGI